MNIRNSLIGAVIGAFVCAIYLHTPPAPVNNEPQEQWHKDVAMADERQRIILQVVDSLTKVIDVERAQRQRADSVAAAWERHFTRANYRDSSTVRKLEFITGRR